MWRIRKWIEFGHSLLAPRRERCALCGAVHGEGSESLPAFCRRCGERVPWITDVACDVCGRPEACPDCPRRAVTFFVKNRSAVRYSPDMKAFLARYKFRGDERLRDVFVDMLVRAYRGLMAERDMAGTRFDCVAFVPVAPERLMERGFNQAEQMAAGLGKAIRIPVVPLVTRVRHTEKQSKRSRIERLEALSEAFACDAAALRQFKSVGSPLRVLLVDDVYTTGSTLNQCAKAICAGLPARVYGLTWARS
jgi:ComF family protein